MSSKGYLAYKNQTKKVNRIKVFWYILPPGGKTTDTVNSSLLAKQVSKEKEAIKFLQRVRILCATAEAHIIKLRNEAYCGQRQQGWVWVAGMSIWSIISDWGEQTGVSPSSSWYCSFTFLSTQVQTLQPFRWKNFPTSNRFQLAELLLVVAGGASAQYRVLWGYFPFKQASPTQSALEK